MKVPFNRPYCSGLEIDYIRDAVRRNKISGDGYYSRKVQNFMEEKFKAKKALFVNSGTAALDMSAILVNIEKGDEVILPSFTFTSTANAFLLRGACLKFVDINPDTLNIDPEKIAEVVSEKTKVIVPVHYAGISCEMDEILKISEENNIFVIEDAAQGVNAKYHDKYLGTIGDIGCYSFHETKNYISGEGGAIIINNEQFMERSEYLREKGTNRSKFFKGEVDKYTWVDIGSSFIGSDILAAYLMAQFEKLEWIQERRRYIYDFYYSRLKSLQAKGYLRLPIIPKNCSPNYHLFYILLPDERQRDEMLKFLNERGVNAVFHYLPLHTSPMGKKMGYREGDLPITENLSSRLIRLPFFNEITDEQLEWVVSSIYKRIESG